MEIFALGFFALLAAFLWWDRSVLYASSAQRAFQKGDRAKTLKLFAKAEAAGRLGVEPTASYAYLLLREGLVDEAGALLTWALRKGRRGKPLKEPQRRLLDTYRALVLWKQGEGADAVALLENLLAQGYRTQALYGNLGFLLLEQGLVERAGEVCAEAAEWAPDGRVILDNLAGWHLAMGDWTAAGEVYDRLLALEPRFPEAWYGAGRVALHSGDRDEARRRWERALELPFHHLSTVERGAVESALAELEGENRG